MQLPASVFGVGETSPVAGWDFDDKNPGVPGRDSASLYSRLIPQQLSARIACSVVLLLFLLVVFGIEIEQPSGTSVAMSDYEAFALWRSRARYDPSAIPNATLNATPWVVHRFSRGASPQMCLQCVMIPGIKGQYYQDMLKLQMVYAQRHGYDLYTFVGDAEGYMERRPNTEWYKLLSTQWLIESGKSGCDYIFWIDTNSLIMNLDFTLESLIHWNKMQDTDAVISADTLAVNLNQGLWKFTRFTRDLLVDAWSMRERDGPKVNLHATGAMASILGGCQPHQSFQQKQKCYDVMDRGWRDHGWAESVYYPGNNQKIGEVVVNKTMLTHIKWVPRHVINSYPGGSFWGKFALGDGSFLVHTFWSPNEPRMMALINYALKNAGLPTNASSANSQATMG